MDDWNDFGVASVERTGTAAAIVNAFRRRSQPSEDSNDEPCSVMFRGDTHLARVSNADGGQPLSSRTYERSTGSGRLGDLDSSSDFDELGISSTLNSHSRDDTYRYHRRSYTKLEAISSVQIQQIVHFFHIVIAIALSWTTFSLIITNSMFVSEVPVKLRRGLFNETGLAAIDQANDQSDPFFDDEFFPFTQRTIRQDQSINCYYASLGIYNIQFSFVNGQKLNCANPRFHSDSCCQSPEDRRVLHTSLRQILTNDENRTVTVNLRTDSVDGWYKTMISMVQIVGGATLLILGTLFVIRLVRTGRSNLSQEQLFACALLFCGAVYFNIISGTMALQNALGGYGWELYPAWFNYLEAPMKVLRDFALGPFFMLYFWATIHSYRILDPEEKLTLAFYLPKLAFILHYYAIHLLAYLHGQVIFSEAPFISAIVLAHAYKGYILHRQLIIYAVASVLFELAYIIIIVSEVLKTLRVLRKAPYMRHRAKQIGFRFFTYLSTVYVATFYLLCILLIVALPTGFTLQNTGIGTDLLIISPVHTVGPVLLTLGFVVVSAFVNLPYNSVGALRGWFKGSDLAQSSSTWTVTSSDSMSDASSRDCGLSGTSVSSSYPALSSSERPKPTFIVDRDQELLREIVEPITYRKRESDDALELKANCFTMQTHVIMFNFAWYVYYYGTPKFDNLNPTETVLPFKFSVAESIFEQSTDTHALVIDGMDRIIVAFKGTTSMRNLKTSMQIYHERLVNVVPTNLDGVNELNRLRFVFGRSYEAAKIHKGFAAAYASVAHRVMRRIQKLMEERPRPLFLTGHSLGGALATICSLDVWIKLKISRRQIFVSTFGSPRVGNEAFRRVYDSVIALHWRIVVDPDMIAKLPKGMYRHVGKKVLLTPHGQMFIDPSALELKLWSGSTAGLAYHRKASYLLAMRAWCVRHHRKSYTPAFFPFPVRDDDYARFEGADTDLDESMHSSTANKIVIRDTMVDALDYGTVDALAVELWARLTRRLLLRHKLVTSAAV